MTLNDPLSSILSKINNAEKVGKTDCSFFPSSKVIKAVLNIMHEHGYIGEVKEIEDSKGNILNVKLLGNINKTNAIKPRFSVTKDDFTKFEKRFLPAMGMGIMMISTSKGIMTVDEAKQKLIGGKLIAFCY